ncbi:MAG: hypothetical protein KJ767_00015 [Nanoarchaeota archaeon]|nr:hypothetical protein [Nanoarchaeota archaeon]
MVTNSQAKGILFVLLGLILVLPLVLADTASFISPYNNVETDDFPTNYAYVNLEKSKLDIFDGKAVVKAYSNNQLADLTIRRERGLGIATGEFDEIDSQYENERIEIIFDNDVYIRYIELRSLYASSYDNPAGEKAEIDFYRNGNLVYHEDNAYGTGTFKQDNGIWSETYNKKVDKIIFYVDETDNEHDFTSFSLAKIKIDTDEQDEEDFTDEEDWYCTSWNQCINGIQTRDCTDLNNAGTSAFKPIEQRNCLYDTLYYDENGNLITGATSTTTSTGTGLGIGITGQDTFAGRTLTSIYWLLILNAVIILIIIFLLARIIASRNKNKEE